MSTPISDFDYHLPKELIAQHSVEPRDHSRLMLLDRTTGDIQHKHFFDVIDELHQGDALVFNDTKVFKARLSAIGGMPTSRNVGMPTSRNVGMPTSRNVGMPTSRNREIFLLRCLQNSETSLWSALLRPGKKVLVGDHLFVDDVQIEVKAKHEDGIVELVFPMNEANVLLFTDVHGSIPIPPYVSEVPDEANKYQTVYAREVGSVAAPTAGFHFTEELLEKIKAKGVQICFVTLHVGIGTFRPVQTETIEEHIMHSEFVTIPKETSERINEAKKEGRRVIAVGTTTVRSLEGVAAVSGGVLPETFFGDVNIFIKPGFQFQIIDALITNFHLPKSTLLILISAFAGREQVFHAYESAVQEKYRFFSFGDAMFIS